MCSKVSIMHWGAFAHKQPSQTPRADPAKADAFSVQGTRRRNSQYEGDAWGYVSPSFQHRHREGT